MERKLSKSIIKGLIFQMLDCEGRRGQTQLQEGLGNVEIMKKRAGSGERFFPPI